MKYFVLFLGIIFLTSSCQNDPIPTIVCDEDCLFLRSDAAGIVSFTNCYDRWSITFNEDSLVTLIINPPAALMQEDLEVEVDASFFDNDIPFLLPDPPGPINYKAEIHSYKILR